MKPGDTVRLKRLKHYFPIKKGENGLTSVDFALPDKKKVGIFLFMGVENQDGTGPQIDPDTFLRDMGWEFKDDSDVPE